MSSAAADRRWMALALSLGSRGLGRVWPNPAVGCVIVQNGRCVGRGWTQDGGRPHAETMALAHAGKAARDADVFVTLEPCAHHGKTPPCAEALIAAGVGRVLVATGDPDPRVNGKGVAMLRDAGIQVVEGLMHAEAQAAQSGFLSRVTLGRPSMTLKLAVSLDGRIATGAGHSQWITGPQARRVVHGLRATHDAVMVGAGTARADLPSLTVRDLGVSHQPVRIVVSSRLDIPQTGPLAETAKDGPVWLLHGPDVSSERQMFWSNAGANLLEVSKSAGGTLDMAHAMQRLGEAGLTRVLCEGGGQLAASLLQTDCVDRLVHFTGGVAIGAEGLPSIGALGLSQLGEAQRFELRSQRQIGTDMMADYHRIPNS